MNRLSTMTTVLFALAGCTKTTTTTIASTKTAISESDAAKIADETLGVWKSMDAAKINATYAPDIAGFDMVMPALISDRATWNKATDGFAAAKIDGIEATARKIQVLNADTFIVSQSDKITSSAMPKNNTTVRCTDVFEKGVDGKWLIVNEHCSVEPKK